MVFIGPLSHQYLISTTSMTKIEEIKELLPFIRPYPLTHLYRYRSMESKEIGEIFGHRKIYLSNPTIFNDPFECKPNLTIHSRLKREFYLKQLAKDQYPNADKKTIKKQVSRAKRKLLTGEGLIERVYEKAIRKFGIYCLSEKNDDILMWSHYSDGHKGMCIEYDASQEGTLFSEAFKVIYQENYPIVNVMDIGKPKEFSKAFLTKSIHWEYEQEWRILKTPEEGGPGFYSFPPELLTGLILGALIPENDRTKILNWISAYPSKINVYQAKISRTKYQLDIEPIKMT